MRQTRHLDQKETLTPDKIHELLFNKFNTIDYHQARQDVDIFLKDTEKTSLWSMDFFHAITQDKLQFVILTDENRKSSCQVLAVGF